MRSTVHFAFALALLSLQPACEKTDSPRPQLQKKGGSANADGSKKNPSLLLTWQGPKSPLSTYHIFYQAAPGKDLEIDSLSEREANVPNPEITIDESNLENWPASGKEACFFIVAENQGALSEPSDKVCIKI